MVDYAKAAELLIIKNDKLQERIKELKELLTEYGRHSEGCPAQYNKKYDCNCGWDREKVLKGKL